MPGPEILAGSRVVATPAALDAADWPAGAVVLRLAADEALVLGEAQGDVSDAHALMETESGLCGVEMTRRELEDWLEREAEWGLPAEGGVAQGMAAGLPVKAWVDGDRALLITRASLAAELEERL